MTSSFRAFFGVAYGLAGIAARIFCRTSAERRSISAGDRISPRAGRARSRLIGTARENSVKRAPKAGCTTASNTSIARNRSPGALTVLLVSSVRTRGRRLRRFNSRKKSALSAALPRLMYESRLPMAASAA